MTLDWNFWIILFLLCVLAYTAARLRTVRKEVQSVRKDMRGFADTSATTTGKLETCMAKLSNLLVAVGEHEAAANAMNDPKIKRLKMEHAKRVGAQGKFDQADKLLTLSKQNASQFLQENK